MNPIERQSGRNGIQHHAACNTEKKARAGIVAEAQRALGALLADCSTLVEAYDRRCACRIAAQKARQQRGDAAALYAKEKTHGLFCPCIQDMQIGAGDQKPRQYKVGKQRRDQRRPAHTKTAQRTRCCLCGKDD